MTMWHSMRFAAKHAVAGSVVIGGVAVLAGASYFALLVWSVLAGLPLGGPLAFPFMVLLALVASVVAVLVVLFPVTVLAEVCSRHFGWPAAAQIPVATVMLVLQVFVAAVIIGALSHAPPQRAMLAGVAVAGVLLLPLGAYWWSLQSTDWLLRLATRSWSHLRHRDSHKGAPWRSH